MLKVRALEVNHLCGMYFEFEKKGDILTTHTHSEKRKQHITIVLKGSVRAFGEGFDHILKASEVYNFKRNEQTHAIEALEDDTLILNIQKNVGLLEGFPPEDLKELELYDE